MALTGVVLFNALVYLPLPSLHHKHQRCPHQRYDAYTDDGPRGRDWVRSPHGTSSSRGVGELGRGGLDRLSGSLGALTDLSFNRGDLIMLVAALTWAIYTILLNRMRGALSPLATLTIVSVIAVPPLGVIGGYELMSRPIGTITPTVVVGLVYISVLASVAAFMAWSVGIKGIGAARGSIFLNLIPVFTAVIAVLTLGERIGLVQLIGGSLVIGGVTLASLRGRKPT